MTPKPRLVDNETVCEPKFYGEVGGKGWFAELQYPERIRLTKGYDPRLNKDVWSACKGVYIFPLPTPVDLQGLKTHFSGFGEIVRTFS
jgi:hypothetical protein